MVDVELQRAFLFGDVDLRIVPASGKRTPSRDNV